MVVTRVVLVELGSLLFQPPAETGIVTERNARPDTAACSVIPQKLRASKQRTAATVQAGTTEKTINSDGLQATLIADVLVCNP